jgi:hypothetical protein
MNNVEGIIRKIITKNIFITLYFSGLGYIILELIRNKTERIYKIKEILLLINLI